jgi:hypothetical protein
VSSVAQQGVLVLGMHRSGTSTITAGLEALGFALGQSKRRSAQGNEKGFFENWEVVSINNRLLRAMGGSWDAPPPQDQPATDPAAVASLAKQAVEVLRKHYGDAPRWALKDPRLCLTLPFWRSAIESAGLGQVRIVHIVRSPLEVALSQQRRHQHNPDFHILGGDIRYTLLLWYEYYRRAIADLAQEQSLLVRHAEMMEKPGICLQNLATLLEVPAQADVIQWFEHEFVEPELHRQRRDHSELTLRFPDFGFVQALFERLLLLDPRQRFSAQELRARVLAAAASAASSDARCVEALMRVAFEAGVVAGHQRLRMIAERKENARILQEVTDSEKRLAGELQAIKRSRAWKLVQFVRRLGA